MIDEEHPLFDRMKASGADPAAVYARAKFEGVDRIACYRLLRRLFGLHVEDAKRVMMAADEGRSLEDQQERLLPGIEETLRGIDGAGENES